MGQRENLKENKKYIELNKNENATHQNMWGTVNAVLRGKFIVLNF